MRSVFPFFPLVTTLLLSMPMAHAQTTTPLLNGTGMTWNGHTAAFAQNRHGEQRPVAISASAASAPVKPNKRKRSAKRQTPAPSV
jgi:hypothetical protein